jgi:nucleoside phosphorylase
VARIGPCESVSAVADGREKRALASEGAISVDMESGPLARWADDHRVPFLSARVVLDPLDVVLPFSTSGSVALSIARHPIRGFRIVRLAVRAARRLGAALDELLPALREPA